MSSLGNSKGFGLFLKTACFIIFVLLLFATEFYEFLTHIRYLSFIIYEVYNAKSFIRYFKNYIICLCSIWRFLLKSLSLFSLWGLELSHPHFTPSLASTLCGVKNLFSLRDAGTHREAAVCPCYVSLWRPSWPQLFLLFILSCFSVSTPVSTWLSRFVAQLGIRNEIVPALFFLRNGVAILTLL